MVSLQVRPSSLAQNIKEAIASGQIGKVVSTIASGTFSPYHGSRPAIVEKAAYFADANTGDNVLTIHFGHCVETSLTGFVYDLQIVK
jgi:predicted dehydrogenase